MPESNSSKCFSSVLSRLLCSGGLPTHPSEQLIESNTVKLKLDLDRKVPESEENAKRGSNPGVVARLMGLESFPDHQKERTLGDYFRSRSVNSIDFLSHLDPVNLRPRNDYRHRRVRTSVSFREGLDDELASVVLLLEKECQMREKNRKEEREIQERRKSVYGKNVEISNIKDKRKPVVRGKSDLMKKRKDLEGKRRAYLKERRPLMMRCDEPELKGLKKKKKKKKILAQNLNFDSSKIQSEGIAPEVARASGPRKDEPSCSSNYSHCEGVIIAERNEAKMTMKMSENLWYKEMVEEICLLTEESARESWVYGMELKFDNFEEICRLFGHEILELMLTQFVDELFQYFGKEIKIN